MKVVTVEKKLYRYEELTEEVKEKVKQSNFESNVVFESDNLKYEFEEIIKEEYRYFEYPSFNWSLGNSQGDGVSFSSEFRLSTWLEEHYPTMSNWKKEFLNNYVTVQTRMNSSRYCYASADDVEFYLQMPLTMLHLELMKLINTIVSNIQEEYLSICKELEKIGYRAFEYLYTEEFAIDNAEANDYWYEADGSIY